MGSREMAKRSRNSSDDKAPRRDVRVKRRTSIRARILRHVLPIVIIPTLVLGALTLGTVRLFENRTQEGVESAETILTEQVVEAAVTRSAQRGAREIGKYVDGWITEVARLNRRSDVRAAVDEANTAVRDLDPSVSSNLGDIERLLRRTRLVADERIRSLQIELTQGDIEPQITLAAANGIELGSTLNDDIVFHGDSLWFRTAIEDGFSIRAFVMVPDGEPSLEIAVSSLSMTFAPTGVLRVLVPLRALHPIIDDLVLDNGVEAVVIDKQASVLLADSTSRHDPEILYQPGVLASGSTAANLELLSPGTLEDEVNLTAARSVASIGDNEALQWLVQATQPVAVASEPLASIRAVQTDVQRTGDIFTYVVATLLMLALVTSLIGSRSLAGRITAPITKLSDQAQEVAETGIPAVVSAAENSETNLPTLPPFAVDSNDELLMLANSLNIMQDAAVDLAGGQAKLRRQNVAQTFVSLGRRNQNLLNRQLEFIDELEGSETDPDTLENLFRLDHLATRMRRNAENLLVLAGEKTPRRWSRPIAVLDVIRAAASEIGDYKRVRLGEVDSATVSGSLATDLSHLIAELLENAGAFSPPGSPIDILGQQTPTHYRLAIIDQGIGMDDAALAQANQRLANPVEFADAPSAYLGLFVVGHLARQLDITVRLAKSNPTGTASKSGTIAFVDLPVTRLSGEDPTPVSIPDPSFEARLARPSVTPPPTPSIEPATAPAVPETTAAGFPKRTQTVPASNNNPQAAPIVAPPIPETAPPAVPVTQIVQPLANATTVAAPQAMTSAGFPKRQATAPAAQPSATTSDRIDAHAPVRSAESASKSIQSFRDAVARGRADAPNQPPVERPVESDE